MKILKKITNAKSQMRNHRGFSMVELIVAVAIIAILSVSSVAGFGYLSDIMRSRQTAGVIQDIVKGEELKVLRGDFKKSSIHFLQDFIITEQEPEGADTQLLSVGGVCGSGGYYLNFSGDGNLTKKDQNDKIMEITQAVSGVPLCVEFNDSKETKWSFQVIEQDTISDLINFEHFNLNRDSLNDPINIQDGAGSYIIIEAPYSKKSLFDASGKSIKEISLKIKDINGHSEDVLTLK